MDIRGFNKPENVQGTSPNQVVPTVTGPNISQKPTNVPEELKLTTLADDIEDIESNQVIKEYIKLLADEGITKEDIFSVLDSIVTSGEVFWSFQLLGKIPVRLKMRPAWVNSELTQKLDKLQPKTYACMTDIINIYNLAGSLDAYKEQNLGAKESKDLDTLIDFVSKLPSPILYKLIKKLAIFDRLLAVAMSDWAVENFTSPPLEK